MDVGGHGKSRDHPVEHDQNHCAHDRLEDVAPAARKRDPAEDRRGDRLELVAPADGRHARSHVRGHQQAGDPVESPRRRKSLSGFRDGYRGIIGSGLIAPNRVDVPTDREIRSDEIGYPTNDQQADEKQRHYVEYVTPYPTCRRSGSADLR